MYKIILSLAVLVAFAGAADAESTKWHFDSVHSNVGFSVRHLGLSKVRGSFTEVKTEIKADAKTGKLTEVKATVGVQSINTGNSKRDEHLRAPDFFDVKQFPEMKLSTEKIKWSGNKFSGTAQMTIKDITQKVKFKGKYLGAHKVNFDGQDQLRAGYAVEAKIKRSDFNLTFSAMAEGIAVVGDKVTIQLDVELMRAL